MLSVQLHITHINHRASNTVQHIDFNAHLFDDIPLTLKILSYIHTCVKAIIVVSYVSVSVYLSVCMYVCHDK